MNAVNRLVAQLFQLQKESSTAVKRLWNDETSIKFLSEDFHRSLVAERKEDDNEMMMMIRPEDTLGYVLLLAAQTLERLALHPSENATAMAWLAFATAPLSCPPQQQSDYLSTRAARHVAGRAFLASAIAANQALMHLTTKDTISSNHASTAMAILAAILALDTTAGSSLGKDDTASGTTSRQVRQVWEIARASLQIHAEKYWLEKEQEEIDKSNSWDTKMETCWSCMDGVGRDGGVSPSALVDVFAQAIDQYYLITDHGSASSRWEAMALTMHGEPSWLETCIALLDGPWKEYWSCPGFHEIVNPEPAASASIQPIQSRGTDDSATTVYEFSGSVVAVMLVSRTLQMFRAVSRCVGRKFNGNLQVYINACWSGHSIDKKHDPRDAGAVLLYQILAVHRQCLDTMELPVVNDDDNIETKEAIGSYYPFVNDVLEHLSIAVSSSPSLSLSHESQVQVKNCLDGLAVAFIFQQHSKPNVIDARLIQYAMSQLVRALSQGRSSQENASWLSKKTYALPLEVPSLSAKMKGQRKKNTAKSTFAGMFPGEHGPPHRGDAKLALVLRAVSSVCSWETRCSVLLTLVLDLITSLYDTRNVEYPTTTSARTASGDCRKPPSVSSHLRNSRPGKRRKLENVEDENTASDQSSWSRMTGARALVCSTALEALALCLRFPHNDQTLTQLQRLLRPSMSSDHVLGVIRLENALSAVMLCPVIDDHLTGEDGMLDILSDEEKKLW